MPAYPISDNWYSGRCSQSEFDDVENTNCLPCSSGESLLGGCAGTYKNPTGTELKRRPNIFDESLLMKATGSTHEGGYLRASNGWPGSRRVDDDVADGISCASANDCKGAFEPHIMKSARTCLAIIDVQYTAGMPENGNVGVFECNAPRSWSRFGRRITENNGACGVWGQDCLDVWRRNYDWTATHRDTMERDDAFFAPSYNEELYRNNTITPVNMPWMCMTAASNKTGSDLTVSLCDGTPTQQWVYLENVGFLQNVGSKLCVQMTTNAAARGRQGKSGTYPNNVNHNNFDGTRNTVVAKMFPCDGLMFDALATEEPELDWENDAKLSREDMLSDMTSFADEFFLERESDMIHGAYWYDMDQGVVGGKVKVSQKNKQNKKNEECGVRSD